MSYKLLRPSADEKAKEAVVRQLIKQVNSTLAELSEQTSHANLPTLPEIFIPEFDLDPNQPIKELKRRR